LCFQKNIGSWKKVKNRPIPRMSYLNNFSPKILIFQMSTAVESIPCVRQTVSAKKKK
jgi:hypothetical protein